MAAALLGAPACAAPSGPQAEALALPPLPPGSPVEALGALVLRDGGVPIHGISGLHLDDELRLTAVTDLGRWLTARLVLRDGRPAGLEGLRGGPLHDGAGRPLARGHAGDAEALARTAGGTWLVGFERWHRIRAFDSLDGPGRYVEAPSGLARAPINGGLEALTVLADGRWLGLAESLAPAGSPDLLLGWLGGPDGWAALAYRPAPGHVPVEAAALPDGGVLVLERSFSLFGGFGGRLARVRAGQLAAGTILEPEHLLTLGRPLPVENYEGMAAARHDGRTLVVLASDDNENLLQRTLLLVLALRE